MLELPFKSREHGYNCRRAEDNVMRGADGSALRQEGHLRRSSRQQERAADFRRAQPPIDLRHNGGLHRKAAARHHRPSLRKRIHDRTGRRIPDTQTRAEEPRRLNGQRDFAHDARNSAEKEGFVGKKCGSVPCGRKAAHRSQGAAQEPRYAAERTGVCRFQRRNAYGYVPHKAEKPGRIHGGLRSRSKKSHSLRGSVSRNHSGVFIKCATKYKNC